MRQRDTFKWLLRVSPAVATEMCTQRCIQVTSLRPRTQRLIQDAQNSSECVNLDAQSTILDE